MEHCDNPINHVGRPVKQIQDFLSKYKNPRAHVGHEEYIKCPASAFLRYTIEVKDVIELCIKNLPKKQDNQLTQASQDAVQQISVAMLPSIMGHFETYQKFIFAKTYAYSENIDGFDGNKFLKNIGLTESGKNVTLSAGTVLSNRGSIQSVGLLLAENLNNWHSPKQVNTYFSAFGLKNEFYSNIQREMIETLWQLRHSIVHTGGTLTKSDAQKIDTLRIHGNRAIAFQNRFLIELCKKFHKLTKDITNRHLHALKNQFKANLTAIELSELEDYFAVESSYPSLF